MKEENLWQEALKLNAKTSQENFDKIRENLSIIQQKQAKKASSLQTITKISFGTSGWREQLGEEFTQKNLEQVLSFCVNLLDDKHYRTFLQENKKENIVLLCSDTRFHNDKFLSYSQEYFIKNNIRAYNLGVLPTGILSCLLKYNSFALSLNFTASHNDFSYSGVKINDALGAPLQESITNRFEVIKQQKTPSYTIYPKQEFNALELFLAQLKSIFPLDKLRDKLIKMKDEINLLINFNHGAACKVFTQILGKDLYNTLVKSNSLHYYNEEIDSLFGGNKPEPNLQQQEELQQKLLQLPKRKFSLGAIFDADADRVRLLDQNNLFDMNTLAPILYYNYPFLQQNCARSCASSHLMDKVTASFNKKCIETKVGFKHFAKLLENGEISLAFEESDGLAISNYSLDKCAIITFLLSLNLIVEQQQSLSELKQILINKFGNLFYFKSTIYLKQKSDFEKLSSIILQEVENNLQKYDTKDGLKIYFNDTNWLLLRPSGTESLVRFYCQASNKEQLTKYHALIQQKVQTL